MDDFKSLYEASYVDVYRLVFGILRDRERSAEVTQEAYLAAYEKRDTYRGDAPATHWIMRIAANKAISVSRRESAVRRTVRWFAVETATVEANLEGRIIDRMVLEAAVSKLSARQRAVLTMRYVHDLDYASIAQILSTTTNSVGVTLSKSLQRLRHLLAIEDPQ